MFKEFFIYVTENNSTKTNYRAFPSTLKITRNDAELYTKLLLANRKHTATGKKNSAFEKRFCMSFILDFQKNFNSKISISINFEAIVLCHYYRSFVS